MGTLSEDLIGILLHIVYPNVPQMFLPYAGEIIGCPEL